jgi:hypothetical protein
MTEPVVVLSLAVRRRPRALSAGPGLLRRLAWWSARLLLCCAAGAVCAQASSAPIPGPNVSLTPSTDEAKATHLHRFAGFVEWPAASFSAPDAPIVIGVVGSPGVHRELGQIVAGRLVQNRAMQVVELAEPRQAATVHMLMIGRGAGKRSAEWMAAAKGHPVLVITDLAYGVDRGAALSFIESDGRLRFEASVPAAEAAGLRLSSRLLPLAERVVKAP